MKWDAMLYDEQNGLREAAGIKLIKMAGIGPDDKVLDIGCGTGTLTARIARLAQKGKVVGLDPSVEMLDVARAKAAPFGNVSLVRGRAEEMGFTSEFSLAYSSNALQWVLDQDRAVRNIYSALEPGGRLAVQLPSSEFSHVLIDCIRQGMGAIERLEEFYLPWYLPERREYEELLSGAGFFHIRTEYEDFSLSFRSSSDALDWALSAALVPYLSLMDWRQGEYFKYAVAMNFERYRKGVSIVCDFRRLIAHAHKPH